MLYTWNAQLGSEVIPLKGVHFSQAVDQKAKATA